MPDLTFDLTAEAEVLYPEINALLAKAAAVGLPMVVLTIERRSELDYSLDKRVSLVDPELCPDRVLLGLLAMQNNEIASLLRDAIEDNFDLPPTH